MNLGVFLAIGESFADFTKKGQDKLLINQNLAYYSKAFKKVYVFSYGKEESFLHNNVQLLGNRWGLHRYLYSLLLPILHRECMRDCHLFRGLQLTGGIPGVIASLIYKKPLVINYGFRYSKMALKEGKYWQALLYRLIEPIVLSQASSVIVTNQTLKKNLERKYSGKLVYIPNGVDIGKFKPRPHGEKKKRKQILFVGRLEKSKNLGNLIEAVTKLSKLKKIELVFIGSGSQAEKLKNYATEKKVSLRIKGMIPHDELPEHLCKADIFVLPSLEEGHPKALLEAMACGLPVVGTKVIGIKEIIENGKSGLLCQVDAQSIAEAMEKILNDAELVKRLGERGRNDVVKNFSLKKTMAKEVKLLHSLS